MTTVRLLSRAPSLGALACKAAGWLLVLSGLVYLVLWGAKGLESLSGPISLRKPILFGLSTGVTVLSISWIIPRLRPRRGDSALFVSFAVALVLEVFLIDLQQARGVPSHFNRATPVDEAVTRLMGALILWATVIILDVTVRAFRVLELPSDYSFAVRAGLIFLAVGCGLGFVITLIGESQIEAGLSPELYGEAGVLKFPHGLPLHAIQVLPLQVWLLKRLGVAEAARFHSVVGITVVIGAATVYGCIQTAVGAPRWPPVALGWVLIGAMILGLFAAAVSLRRKRWSDEP